MSGPRSVAIDLVRVIAVVGVILRHTWYDPTKPVAMIVCPWAIAIFFVLSGYLWSHKRDVAQEARHRAAGLLVPYACWVALIAVPYFVWAYHEYTVGWATWLLMGVGYGGSFMVVPFSACWFFTVMFVAVVLLRWLERYPRWVTWAVVVASIAGTVVVPVVFRYGPLGSGLALPCLTFLVLGQELRRVRPRITQPFLAGLACLAIGAAAVLLGTPDDGTGQLLEIKQSMYGMPVLGILTGVVISFGLILVAESLDKVIPESAGAHVVRLASAATFVIFLHPCLLFIMGTPWSGGYLDFAVALIVPYALALVCLRMGWLPWLTGDQRSCAALVERILPRRLVSPKVQEPVG